MNTPHQPFQPHREPPEREARRVGSTGSDGLESTGQHPYAGFRRWIPAVAASAVLAVVLVAAMSGRSDGSAATPTVPASAAGVIGATTTAPASTAPVVVVATDPAVQKSQLSSSLSNGMAGDEVTMVQQRLTDLGFQPGPVDGIYGTTTQQAVWAFEKLVLKTPRGQATGVVTNEMWQTMQDGLAIAPRRPQGPGTTHVEIYVPEQVMAVFSGDTAEFVTHIATGEQNADGSAKEWCDTLTYDTDVNGNKLDEPVKKQECAAAKTPGGIFRIDHELVGNHISPLGGMLNPVFFNYGIAIHGAQNVPLEPASHGCVRISNFLAKTFPSLVKPGDRVYVWAQDGKEPEQYTKNQSLPSFNYRDPSATTTTSSTTSTTSPPTTVAATTVVATTTTVRPAVTTTTTTAKPPTPTTTTTAPVATTAPPTTAADPTTSSP